MDTKVIIIMIVCATVIALVAIICDHLFERKSKEVSDNLLSEKIIKVHRNYIAGFLGFAIIMLITANYGGPNNDIYEYLSFGSTITSLVLSILAIFVTVRSSSDLYKQFGTINKVSNQIDATLNSLKEAETQLKITSSDITCQMDNIVSEIEKRLDKRLQKTESAISGQIQKQNLDTQNVKAEVKANANLDPAPFLNNMSFNGLWSLYVCSKGSEMQKVFVLGDFFKENQLYCLGVIISTRAIGYLDVDVIISDNQYIVDCKESRFKSEDVYEVLRTKVQGDDQKVEENKKKVDEFFATK